ncbi:MAG: PhzF family phenazine biosynthesis protein [Ignavibacteriae bacterium]|nr:PhzF family phenazine biosynthesis protein [Ignavibacteriota bacterium]
MNIYTVDAFINKNKFTGNPAAVCLLPEPADEQWMQNVAAEMNLSETAFLVPHRNGYNIRWFAPKTEVDLCGHATLASAHILYETGNVSPNETIRFHSKSGYLQANKNNDWIELNFPATPEEPATLLPPFLFSLGITARYVGQSIFDYLVEVESEKTVREMKPDFNILRTIPCRGVIVTAKSDSSDYDFVSRYFAPAYGIDEDPVTGSTHCCLAPYWSNQLGKTEFTAYQASNRGGILHVKLQGDRVILGGQAVTILKGELV